MTRKKWYKLDNAAKIFPSVSNKGRTNVFRLSFDMTDTVDPLLLQEALEIVIKRFSMLNVNLKKGLFWYYFETNESIPLIQSESPFITRLIEYYKDNNGFLFRLYYYKKRITLEVFHSLTDGFGALEFLKSIIYSYLELKDVEIRNNLAVLSDKIECLREEDQDSFNAHYNNKLKASRKEPKSLRFKSQAYQHNWLGLIVGTMDAQAIKELSNKYNCSITELIGAAVFYSAYKARHIFDQKDYPFTMFIPVNLRRFFPSRTLRNFSLYVRTKVKLNEEIQFEELVTMIKRDMVDELQKDKLAERFATNVRSERNFALRIVPRQIKEIVLRATYNKVASNANSFSLSNLGILKLPDEMSSHIDKVVFSNGASYTYPVNMGVITYNNKLTISFTSDIIDRSLQREFFRFFTSQGIKIVIENNDLEVE
jgi:NRPS condensation-like uncharacterized protein